MTSPVVFALLSAAAFALATVSQHRAARTAEHLGGHGLGLVRQLATRPLWLLGLVSGAAGLALHGLALRGGQLVVVQPVLVSGLLFALPLSLLEERKPAAWREWAWALAVVVGLSLFLLAAHPAAGSALADEGALASTGAAVLLAAGAAVGLSVSIGRRHRAPLLGAAGGLSFGVTAALLKQVVGQAALSPLAPLTDWSLYALLLVGGAGLVLTQSAYQAGRLAASLPPMTILDPIAAIALGALCFGERLTAGLLPIAAQLAGFLMMTVAVVRLAALAADDAADGLSPGPSGYMTDSEVTAGCPLSIQRPA